MLDEHPRPEGEGDDADGHDAWVSDGRPEGEPAKPDGQHDPACEADRAPERTLGVPIRRRNTLRGGGARAT
jgi:hypothetical protein